MANVPSKEDSNGHLEHRDIGMEKQPMCQSRIEQSGQRIPPLIGNNYEIGFLEGTVLKEILRFLGLNLA